MNARVAAVVRLTDEIVGAVPKTLAPVPVSSVRRAARFALVAVPRNVAAPVARPVTLPIAGVQVAAEIAVVRPFAFCVVVMQDVALPNVPTLLLTVARVTAPPDATVASPENNELI